jgi:antitoxin (DNA-binding transcriptional repressor) of toxin-antitoxin stability system
MTVVVLSEVDQSLKQIIAALKPGEEAAVVDNGKRVAIIRRETEKDFSCKSGSAAGTILYMADDFDAPLDDFAEYM